MEMGYKGSDMGRNIRVQEDDFEGVWIDTLD